jgi:hypothetical protein
LCLLTAAAAAAAFADYLKQVMLKGLASDNMPVSKVMTPQADSAHTTLRSRFFECT